MATKTKTKAAPKADEVDEDLELEDTDDDVEGEKATKSKAQEVTFGVANLAKFLSKKMGKEISTRDLRTQIRRMAREDNARVNRVITAGNRTRYDWPDGLQDPEVKRIIAAVTGGELDEGKKAALNALKEKKAKEKAAGGTPSKKTKSKAKVEEPEEELEDIEDDDSDDDE